MIEVEEGARPFPPYRDDGEKRILEEVKGSGGDIFRVDLRQRIGGSNTTFVRKIACLKERGLLEEYKRRAEGGGRLKTAYRLTDYANQMFNVERALGTEKWFSASQKIELFPEFERMARALGGDGRSVYEALGIEPRHVFLETLLATNRCPPLAEEDVREVLTLCSAFLQNIVTERLRLRPADRAEGHIVFHYLVERENDGPQARLPEYLARYVTSSDVLEQHRARNKIVELTTRYPNLLPLMATAASSAARAMKLDGELRALLQRYRAFKRGEEPLQLTRIHLVLSMLTIFKKLYDSCNERGVTVTQSTSLRERGRGDS